MALAEILGAAGNGGAVLTNCLWCLLVVAYFLVEYCSSGSAERQRGHRKQHKEACKKHKTARKKRVAERKDKRLYQQGHERPEGDFCPICVLPVPLSMGEHWGFMVCCMKRVCNGCDYAAQKRGMFGCPFCRAPYADNDADALAMIQERAVKKDPDAIYNLGIKYYHGELGLQKDMRKAVELWTEAAELGSVDALYSLGSAYYNGEGVEVDKTKGAEFYAKAAMQGHIISRYNLGHFEAKTLILQ